MLVLRGFCFHKMLRTSDLPLRRFSPRWVIYEDVAKKLQNTAARYYLKKEDFIGIAEKPEAEYDLIEVILSVLSRSIVKTLTVNIIENDKIHFTLAFAPDSGREATFFFARWKINFAVAPYTTDGGGKRVLNAEPQYPAVTTGVVYIQPYPLVLSYEWLIINNVYLKRDGNEDHRLLPGPAIKYQ